MNDVNEILREDLLLILDTGKISMRIKDIMIGTRAAGFDISYDTLLKELLYLKDLGFVIEEENDLSASNSRWRITAQGRQRLERKK